MSPNGPVSTKDESTHQCLILKKIKDNRWIKYEVFLRNFGSIQIDITEYYGIMVIERNFWNEYTMSCKTPVFIEAQHFFLVSFCQWWTKLINLKLVFPTSIIGYFNFCLSTVKLMLQGALSVLYHLLNKTNTKGYQFWRCWHF